MKHLLSLVAGVVLLLQSGATIAWADDKGNNGDVKIHDVDTSKQDHRNEPHVCRFYIEGFNFDGSSSGTWRIEGWAPTGSGVASSGTWGPSNTSGSWWTGDMTLASGHYKLFAKQTAPNTIGGEKQKVFWVDCATSQPGNTGSTGSNRGPSGTTGPSGDTGTSGGTGLTGNTGATAPGGIGVGNNGSTGPSGIAGTPVSVGGVITSPNEPFGGNAQQPNNVLGGVQTLPSTSTDPNEQAVTVVRRLASAKRARAQLALLLQHRA
jgi:hypothetical protein